MMVTTRAQTMTHTLEAWAAARGYQVAWGPIGVLDAVRADLAGRIASAEIDPEFARESLQFDFAPVSDGRRRVVLVVVVPRPAHRVSFVVGGRQIDTILPPTYERYRATFEDVRADLAAAALPGASVETLTAPLKPLAARLGVVRYGRNNVTYAPGLGSYLQLLAYLTDADLTVAPDWRPREPRLLEACERCGICEAVCPTEALAPDRVLLHAERCLTRASETDGAWPTWVPASAHHCLVGCLRCQQACPENPDLPVVTSGVAFTEDETATLLAGRDGPGVSWPGIHAKLERLGLSPPERLVVGRNLRALLQAPGAARPSIA